MLVYSLKHCRAGNLTKTNLRNGSVVPNVAFMWENIGNKSQLALLYILLYWVQEVFCSDLEINCIIFTFKDMISSKKKKKSTQKLTVEDDSRLVPPSLHLSILVPQQPRERCSVRDKNLIHNQNYL